MTTRYDDMMRDETDREYRFEYNDSKPTARRITLDDTESRLNEIFPPPPPKPIPITVGSIVSLRGFKINPYAPEYVYPIMTVYDIFNKDRCRCYWYVNGVQHEAIYGMDILINRG